MNKRKAIVVTVLLFVLLTVLAADVVAVMPGALVWILAVFAVPGLWKFAKLLYWWLTTEDQRGIKIPRITLPLKRKKHSVNWTKVWAGVPQKGGEE